MDIVILDGFTLNPGDLSWAPFHRLGTCRIYDRSRPEEVIERAEGAAAVLINKVHLSGEVQQRLPALRYIGVFATGYNCVDLRAAEERGIVVTNVPAYGTDSVSQMVFAHLLHHTQEVARHAEGVRRGRWSIAEDWCYWETPLIELAGLTMGIVGYGRIGRAVGRIAQSFGMKVIVTDLEAPQVDPSSGVGVCTLQELFRQSDVVSLHCPLTETTRGMVGRSLLNIMKPAAFLINTARGALIDECALADALACGRLAGAGIDVLPEEPPPSASPLLSAPHCTITPHIAWATTAARRRLLECAAANLQAWSQGNPVNVVR